MGKLKAKAHHKQGKSREEFAVVGADEFRVGYARGWADAKEDEAGRTAALMALYRAVRGFMDASRDEESLRRAFVHAYEFERISKPERPKPKRRREAKHDGGGADRAPEA